MRYCIFCGDRASTKEDAWPLWLMRLFPANLTGTMDAQRGRKVLQSWQSIGPKLTVKYICARCNNGWMSQLEQQVKPIVEAIFSQESVLINSRQQAILGAWAVKNAMVLEALRPAQPWFYLPSERISLKETLYPPAQTYAWIAKCVEYNGSYSIASNLAGIANELTSQVSGYVTTMGFGPLALQVLSMRLPESVPQNATVTASVQPGPWDQSTLCIWPSQQISQKWPPLFGLSGKIGMQALSERWMPGGPPNNDSGG